MADEQVAVSETAAPSEQPVESAANAEVSSWRDGLPAEIRGHKSLESIQDVGALAKGYVHAQSMVGSDKVPIPGKWATDDDWTHVHMKLGRPDEPDGYAFDQPEGVDVDQDLLAWFKQTAHAAGLNTRQAQKLYNDYSAHQEGRANNEVISHDAARHEAETSLQKEWGKAYPQRVGFAKGVLGNFGSMEMADIEMSDGIRLGDHPEVIRMLSKVGQFINDKIGEDSIAGTRQGGALAPDEAREKLRDITAAGSPYWDSRHAEHNWYVQEGVRLREFVGE